MKKKDQYFFKISEYKERLKDLSLEQLRTRQSTGYLYKEAAIALRELIEEKESNGEKGTDLFLAKEKRS